MTQTVKRRLLGTWRCREEPTELLTFQLGRRMTSFDYGVPQRSACWWVSDQTLWIAHRRPPKDLRWNSLGPRR